jgi:hypothetical protein
MQSMGIRLASARAAHAWRVGTRIPCRSLDPAARGPHTAADMDRAVRSADE